MTDHLGELAALGTAFCWVGSALFFGAAGRRTGSLGVNLVRLLIAVVLLSLYGLVVRGHPLPTDATGHQWMWLGISGAVGLFLGDLFLFRALATIGPRLSLLLMSLAPPITAAIGWVWLGEVLSRNDWLGMALTLLGVSWVVLERRPAIPPAEAASAKPPADADETDRRTYALGVACAVLGAAGQAVGYIFSKYGLQPSAEVTAAAAKYDAFAGTQIRVFGALAGFLLLYTVLRRWELVGRLVADRRALALTAAGAVVGPFVGVGLSLVAVTHTEAGVAATIMQVNPVLVIPFVVWIHRERVTPRALFGAVAAVTGVGVLILG